MRIAGYEDKVNVIRVIKVSEPEIINFPLQNRLSRIRDGRDQASDEELEDMFPDDAQDAKPVRKPEPSDDVEPKAKGDLPIHFLRTPGREQFTTRMDCVHETC